jgi:hypothetical protein
MVPVAIATEAEGGSKQFMGGGYSSIADLGGFGIICETTESCATSEIPSYQILLGTNLDLTENSQVYSQSYELQPGNIMGGVGAVDLSYSFEFFEADGVTPVDISLATPEPATLTLFAFPLLIACFLIAFRRFRPYPL